MFKKINAVFRPNHGQRNKDGCQSDLYHKACTVKLVRSTSMLIVGDSRQKTTDSSLKRSKSSISIESTALYYYKQEDRVWLYSRTQDCLQYLEDLMALRRQYLKSVNNLKSNVNKANHSSASTEAKSASSPSPKKEKKTTKTKAKAPPVPDEVNTLEYFDAVIASYDSEKKSRPYTDDGHADVDFIVATSTSDHDLHSNWMLRDPRRFSMDEAKLKKSSRKSQRSNENGTVSSQKKLQRNPIHLPKVVESAFQTLRFKPKLKNKNE
ncbi:uncharacterized protein C13orf42 [Lepisosteus oculatus]|uniref:uncharacterized protein C13orf42 n=1 Tax=Lepisosteus oculatus TaxID=7918 RepID=UPI0035F514F7